MKEQYKHHRLENTYNAMFSSLYVSKLFKSPQTGKITCLMDQPDTSEKLGGHMVHISYLRGRIIPLVSGLFILIVLGSSCKSQEQSPSPKAENKTHELNPQDPWSIMIHSRIKALASLPGYSDFPEKATSWKDYTERMIEELLIYDMSWFDEPSTGIRGFRPYVKGTDQWGGTDRTRQITELIASVDVLWPLYRYLQLHPDADNQAMVDEFMDELPKYHNHIAGQTTNRPGENKLDSWYYMENSILKYGHLLMISESATLNEPYFSSLESAIEMAHNFDYLFPQFVNLKKEKADGYNTQNYSTSGLLAYSLIDAYEMTGEIRYLEEAERALKAMRQVEYPRQLLYEPQELAAGAAAAARMIHYSEYYESDLDFTNLAQDLFYAQVQMLYYDGGEIDLENFIPQKSEWLPDTWRDGLHVPYYNPIESGGINAPAFKESFEAVLFWIEYLRYVYNSGDINPAEPLKVLNLNRIKNFYHFSPNIPDEHEREYGPVSLQYIPYEDIDYYDVREHEDESVRYKAGYNGKEIYGAGETIWAYLMFEALGEPEDHNAMMLNLNVLDQGYPPPPDERLFIVFNPYPEEMELTFTLKHLDQATTVFANSMKLGPIKPSDSFNITLPAYGSALITLESGD
jgi:hypothetical protein